MCFTPSDYCSTIDFIVLLSITILSHTNNYCYIVPLISTSEDEVKTSVGQPTTLHVTVGGDPTPEINWTKNGDPVDHLVLQDSSLYISPTTEDDQGRYTVTATNSEAKSSKTIQLTVLNPRFTQCKFLHASLLT